MEYRLDDGTLNMRAAGYILWHFVHRTGSVHCCVPLWSAGGMISLSAIHWQLHVMRKVWERWWTDCQLSEAPQTAYRHSFLLSFCFRFFSPSLYTPQHYISENPSPSPFTSPSFSSSSLPSSLLPPHSNITITKPPLPQTIRSANHIASDPVLTKVCFPEEKTE